MTTTLKPINIDDWPEYIKERNAMKTYTLNISIDYRDGKPVRAMIDFCKHPRSKPLMSSSFSEPSDEKMLLEWIEGKMAQAWIEADMMLGQMRMMI